MESHTQSVLHKQPSMELPSPKKQKMDFVIGNNRFGSKGTFRCKKCQKRKGKCNYDDPANPCDYCFARGLVCGLKLPTPRKLAEWGTLAMVPGATLPMHMAVGQPLAAAPLQIQIPANVQQINGTTNYNLSSASSDTEPIPFPSPSIIPFPSPIIPSLSNTGYRPHSITSGFASLMSPMSLGITHNTVESCSVVRTWSQHSFHQIPTVSHQSSPELPSQFTQGEPCDTQESATIPCIPARHPLHTLTTSMLPIVRSQIPQVHDDDPMETASDEDLSTAEQTSIADQDIYSEEQLWALWQEMYVQFDNGNQIAVSEEPRNSGPFRLKWNRLHHVPRSMRKKRAGVWPDYIHIKKEDLESVPSLKSAPSIL